MGKVLVQYVGEQQPQDIIEVDENKVEALLKRGDYKLLSELPKPEKVLGEKEQERVSEFVEDLKDDGKRNYSTKKKNKL